MGGIGALAENPPPRLPGTSAKPSPAHVSLEAMGLGQPELDVEARRQDHLCLSEPTGQTVFPLPSAFLQGEGYCAGLGMGWRGLGFWPQLSL